MGKFFEGRSWNLGVLCRWYYWFVSFSIGETFRKFRGGRLKVLGFFRFVFGIGFFIFFFGSVRLRLVLWGKVNNFFFLSIYCMLVVGFFVFIVYLFFIVLVSRFFIGCIVWWLRF